MSFTFPASMGRRYFSFLKVSNAAAIRSTKGATALAGRKITTVAPENAAVEKRKEDKLVQDMLHRIRQINYMPDEIRSSLLDFYVNNIKVGKVRPKMASILCNSDSSNTSPVFVMRQDAVSQETYLTLASDAGDSVESRTQSVARVMNNLRDSGMVSGWRDELYPISDSFYNPPMFLMERAAVSILGVLEYGVHINGLVRNSKNLEEPPQMWIGRRSATKSKFPGMLDHIAAGGQPAGLSLLENVIQECREEAGIPEEMTRNGVHATGVISYESYSPKTDRVSRVVLFNYDLYLPEGWTPTPVDGEVETFFLWTIDQVKESMAQDYADPVKPNCYVSIIHYLVRLGYVSPDTPGYLDVLRELRSGDCR